MDVSTKFNLADVAYVLSEANKGNLVPVIIEKITINVETTTIIVITYQVSSTNLFHNTVFNENELGTYAEVSGLIEDELQEQIDELQARIDDLE